MAIKTGIQFSCNSRFLAKQQAKVKETKTEGNRDRHRTTQMETDMKIFTTISKKGRKKKRGGISTDKSKDGEEFRNPYELLIITATVESKSVKSMIYEMEAEE